MVRFLHLLKKAPSFAGGGGVAVNLALVAVAFSDQVRSHWVGRQRQQPGDNFGLGNGDYAALDNCSISVIGSP